MSELADKVRASMSNSKKNIDAIKSVSQQRIAQMMETPALKKMKEYFAKGRAQSAKAMAKAKEDLEEMKSKLKALAEQFSAKAAAENLAKIRKAFEIPKPVVTDFDRQHRRLGEFRRMTIGERIKEAVANVKQFALQVKLASTQPEKIVTDFDRRREKDFASREAREAALAEQQKEKQKQAKLAAKMEKDELHRRKKAKQKAMAERKKQKRLQKRGKSSGAQAPKNPEAANILSRIRAAVSTLRADRFREQVVKAMQAAGKSMKHLGKDTRAMQAAIRADKVGRVCSSTLLTHVFVGPDEPVDSRAVNCRRERSRG